MGPVFYPHAAEPRPPTVHSTNPETAGRHVTDLADVDPALYPLEALCKSCGQPLVLLTPDSSWMHRELNPTPAQRVLPRCTQMPTT